MKHTTDLLLSPLIGEKERSVLPHLSWLNSDAEFGLSSDIGRELMSVNGLDLPQTTFPRPNAPKFNVPGTTHECSVADSTLFIPVSRS